jgi:serine/threonine-protein kinase RsbW
MEKLVIQSDTRNLVDVERFVSAVCDTYNINNYAATISMSLLQAVENAIVHGNNGDISKQVTITSDYCKGGIYFTVSDQGAGFEFAKYGLMPEEGSGTGIYLMKTLSDRMTYSNNGSTVRLDFVVSGIEASRALERIVTLRNHYAPRFVNA